MTTVTIQTYKFKVVESALFGVAASGFGISAETPLFPSSLQTDKREQGCAHLHPVFYRIEWYHSLFSYTKLEFFVTSQIFHQ